MWEKKNVYLFQTLLVSFLLLVAPLSPPPQENPNCFVRGSRSNKKAFWGEGSFEKPKWNWISFGRWQFSISWSLIIYFKVYDCNNLASLLHPVVRDVYLDEGQDISCSHNHRITFVNCSHLCLYKSLTLFFCIRQRYQPMGYLAYPRFFFLYWTIFRKKLKEIQYNEWKEQK